MKHLLVILNEQNQIVKHELGTFEDLKEKVNAFCAKNTSGGIKADIFFLTRGNAQNSYSLGRPFVEVEEAPKKKRGRPSKED